MTRRERLERKLERRAEWAAKAETRSAQRFNAAHKIADGIPFGQPILVGHHSEAHARRDQDRIYTNMSKACELADLAKHHESKAAGLSDQLERAIFSDDSDATEALRARIAENEAKRDQMKKINSLYRKADVAGLLALGIDIERLKAKLAEAGSYWGSAPHLPYELTNLGARIRDDKKRLEQIERDQVRKAKTEEKMAESDAGVIVEPCNGGYCLVTFADKPERPILDALKAAGFWWSKGSWAGKQDQIPPCVAELLALEELKETVKTCPKIYRNTKFTTRNYECTNVAACVSLAPPTPDYELTTDEYLNGMQQLWVETINGNETAFYGWL